MHTIKALKRAIHFPLYPFFLAAYPVIYLYLHNALYVEPVEIWRSLILSLLFSIGTFYLLLQGLQNPLKASNSTALCVIGFYFYGHVHNFLADRHIDWMANHAVLASLWIIVFAGLIFTVTRISITPTAVLGFNVVALLLLVYSICEIFAFRLEAYQAYKNSHQEPPLTADIVPNDGAHPDIYYIILDGYTRADVMRSYYNYDNSRFLQVLEISGFFVADCRRWTSVYAMQKAHLLATCREGYGLDCPV